VSLSRHCWIFALAACSSGHSKTDPDPSPPANTPVNITTDAPFVAFQANDDADWVALTPTTSVTTYQGMASEGNYAVAVGCLSQLSATMPSVNIYYQTTSDPDLVVPPCTPPVTETIGLQVMPALDPMSVIQLFFGSELTFPPDDPDDGVNVPKGQDDLFGVIEDMTGALTVYRGMVDVDGFQTVTIDPTMFVPPVAHPVTVDNGADLGLSTQGVQVFSNYYTAHASGPIRGLLGTMGAPGAALTYYAIDPSQDQPGDLLEVQAYTTSTNGGTAYVHSASQIMAQPGSPTLTLPADLQITTLPTIDQSPDPRVSVTIPTTGGTLANVTYFALVTSATATLDLHVSASRAQGQDSISLQSPDLSGVAGYSPSLALDLMMASSLTWTIGRDESDGGAPADGQHSMYAEAMRGF
jgi:hypothetical protein